MNICIFGSGGVGKTTIIKYLAPKISGYNAIVDCSSIYGKLQRNLNISVPEEKSLKKALLDPYNLNLYSNEWNGIDCFALADNEAVDDYVSMNHEILEMFYQKITENYDVIFWDCTERLNDEMVSMILKNADKIIIMIDSTVQGIAYYNAHIPAFNILDKPKVIILNKNQANNLNKNSAENLINSKIDLVIPYNPDFHLENINFEYSKFMNSQVEKIYHLLFNIPQNNESKGKKKSFFSKKKKEGGDNGSN